MLGAGEPLWVECEMGDYSFFPHTPIRWGPDGERILDCAFTLKIEPAAPLQPLAISASVVQLLVPSAGKLRPNRGARSLLARRRSLAVTIHAAGRQRHSDDQARDADVTPEAAADEAQGEADRRPPLARATDDGR